MKRYKHLVLSVLVTVKAGYARLIESLMRNKGILIVFAVVITSPCVYAFCLVCGAEMVPDFTKPTYAEICEDISKNVKIIENTVFPSLL